MFLEIITPDKKVFSGETKLVQVPGTKGSFEILKNHAPIISTLDEGTIRVVKPDNAEDMITISGGVLEVKNNKIIILAESV